MPKKQVIFIHGGESYSDYNAFLEHLRSGELRNVLDDKPQRWRNTLRAELGSNYDVYMPEMPNSENAKYEEWRIWFERYLALVSDGVILIGHSQGGWFLAKYLIENTPPIAIGALVLIATPAGEFDGEGGGDFVFPQTRIPELGKAVAGRIYVVHSKDDFVVPYEHALAYKEALLEAELVTFDDRGHFLQETFPELIKLIQLVD